METTTRTSRGILKPQLAEQHFRLTRHAPAPDLADVIDRYWVIDWDLRGQPPYEQSTISSPHINMVFDPYKTGIFGVATKRFNYLLKGQGQVFAVKFHIGAFYPFIQSPVSEFTDSLISLGNAFGQAGETLQKQVMVANDVHSKIMLVEDFLRGHLPQPDDNVALVQQIITEIEQDRNLMRVEDLAQRMGYSPRSLQRLFHQYVGASPKWTIRRYRLQDAADLLDQRTPDDWARLAANLGYFDQAHFIKDFKDLIGETPAVYAASTDDASHSDADHTRSNGC
ncbi:MAG: AraC family transcriptional regulator [Anaerolineaceae bacterium]|nr:AraC family transcriptional regulator [Anaerolineaceae bacterium]